MRVNSGMKHFLEPPEINSCLSASSTFCPLFAVGWWHLCKPAWDKADSVSLDIPVHPPSSDCPAQLSRARAGVLQTSNLPWHLEALGAAVPWASQELLERETSSQATRGTGQSHGDTVAFQSRTLLAQVGTAAVWDGWQSCCCFTGMGVWRHLLVLKLNTSDVRQ